jgi:predicted dehydrogenase
MIQLGIVGLGRMGLSHLAIAGAHPSIEIAGVCDGLSPAMLALRSYKSYPCKGSFEELIKGGTLHAVLIATPTSTHAPIVRKALEAGLHVFVEKPFCLDVAEGEALATLAEEKGLVNQVGYHNRFIGTFREARRLIEQGVLGDVYHLFGEAYGQVVIRRQSSSWRLKNSQEGGCLLDYASHVIDLMNFLVGPPIGVSGTVIRSVWSEAVDDAVYATFFYEGRRSAQISVNWSDEAYRKMSTKVTVLGSGGKLIVDRQEMRIFLREPRPDFKLQQGWNIHYITELTQPVWYYLRGEEYSAQIDHFVTTIEEERTTTINSFRSALETDRVIARLRRDASEPGAGLGDDVLSAPMPSHRRERVIARLLYPRRQA